MNMDEISQIITNTKEQRIKEEKEKHPDLSPELQNECLYNAVTLAHNLYLNNYNPHIVIGGLELGIDTPKTLNEAIKMNSYHVWVECENYIIEIASEKPSQRGEKLISNQIPNNYITFQNGKEKYEPWMKKIIYEKGKRGLEKIVE